MDLRVPLLEERVVGRSRPWFIITRTRANTSLNVTRYSHGDKMGYARYADLLFSTVKICMCIITAIAHATAVTHSITYGSYTFCAINKYTHAMQRDLLEPCAGQLARTVLRGGDRSDAVSLPDLAHKIREAMASEVKDLRLGGAGRHLGRVIVEDDVEIGANTSIDRGAGPDTVIGRGSRIDNLVQIGHNVRLG